MRSYAQKFIIIPRDNILHIYCFSIEEKIR